MKCNSIKINSWQQTLINVVTDPAELLSILELDNALLPHALSAAKLFPLKVPRNFIRLMKKGDINDPLLRQILPINQELTLYPTYTPDPLSETEFNPVPGLLHKYQGRVLLTLAGACGINCRYCFRRHFPYETNNPGSLGWQTALDYVAADQSIHEVILSGGDPLIASDQTLKNIALRLANINHVKRLRIHSRMPIVIPERITNPFIEAIKHSHFKTVLVVHCNHANELSPDVGCAMESLKKADIILLNQSVLLKGVNDNVDILVQLSESLFQYGILPYYLHALDKVQGAAHFDMHVSHAKKLYTDLANRLPGYLVPKLVWEPAGGSSKLPL